MYFICFITFLFWASLTRFRTRNARLVYRIISLIFSRTIFDNIKVRTPNVMRAMLDDYSGRYCIDGYTKYRYPIMYDKWVKKHPLQLFQFLEIVEKQFLYGQRSVAGPKDRYHRSDMYLKTYHISNYSYLLIHKTSHKNYAFTWR